jgi:hypothetical protein
MQIIHPAASSHPTGPRLRSRVPRSTLASYWWPMLARRGFRGHRGRGGEALDKEIL